MKTLNITFFLFLVLLMSRCTNSDDQKEKNKTETSIAKNINAVSPPLPIIKGNYSNFTLNTEKDTSLVYLSGTTIDVPENAFLDKNGKIVKGHVKMQYREFSNAFDIWLSGIPMNYDSAGTTSVFESAGMVEINAYSGNEVLFPNPQNRIKIKMNSFNDAANFNLYQLDSVSGNWKYLGKDKVKKEKKSDIATLLPKIPPEPKKAGSKSFSIGDETGKYPELIDYKNVLFEPVNDEPCGSNATSMNIKILENGMFEITFNIDFSGQHHESKCICYLAFKEGTDYSNAMIAYKTKYKLLLEKRDRIKAQMEKEWSFYQEIKKKYVEAGFIDLFYKKQITFLKADEKITRTFELNGFGFINCDYPSSYPKGADLIASFTDQNGKSIKLKNIVLVEKGRNALFRYSDKIKFNPAKDNILWGLTENNKLAFFNNDRFKTINTFTGNYTFSMTVYNKEIKTYEDIVKLLF